MDIEILGYPWKVYVISQEEMIAKFNEDLKGLTDPEASELYFKREGLDKSTVTHEITHAYFSYMPVTQIDIMEDIEEVWCDFISFHGEKLLKQSKELFDVLIKM
jgi:hypothetical protein